MAILKFKAQNAVYISTILCVTGPMARQLTIVRICKPLISPPLNNLTVKNNCIQLSKKINRWTKIGTSEIIKLDSNNNLYIQSQSKLCIIAHYKSKGKQGDKFEILTKNCKQLVNGEYMVKYVEKDDENLFIG